MHSCLAAVGSLINARVQSQMRTDDQSSSTQGCTCVLYMVPRNRSSLLMAAMVTQCGGGKRTGLLMSAVIYVYVYAID